jgi:transposase-like protein
MLARGLSVRDIEDAFKDETGRLLLSRTAVSELGERLWADYREFATCDLSEDDVAYLFIDGIAERLRPGARREPAVAAPERRFGAPRRRMLAAWGFRPKARGCCSR